MDLINKFHNLYYYHFYH